MANLIQMLRLLKPFWRRVLLSLLLVCSPLAAASA